MPFAKRTVLLAAALLVASCNDPEDEVCTDCAAESLLRQAKEDIGAGQFERAIEKCNTVVESDPESADGHYCLFIAHLGEMTNGVNNLLQAVGSQLPRTDPALAPAGFMKAIDAKPLIAGYFENFEDDMIAVDRQVQFLASRPALTFQIVRFPVHLEFQRIATFINNMSGDYLPGELLLDLGGTWDKSEVLLLGSAFNGVLAGIDYLMAHDLEVRRIPVSDTLSGVVAELLVQNPSLLAFDPAEADARLKGTAEEKGLRKNLIAMLSYLAGRDDDFEGVVAMNEGLQEAIRVSAAAAVTDPVVKWIDDDGDGNPEAIDARFLSEMVDQLSGVYVPRFPIPLAGATFDAFYAMAAALRKNAESGGDAVRIVEFLESLRGDLGSYLIIAPGFKEVPDLIALDLNPFVENTPPVRELFPYFYSAGGAYNLLYELEWAKACCVGLDPIVTTGYGDVYETGTRYFDAPWGGWRSKSSRAHFDVGGAPVEQAGLGLTDDGVDPAGYAQTLVYVALQEPSFGGLLHLNLDSLGGSGGMAVADHASVNEGLARLFKYYCFNLGDSEYGMEIWFTFHTECPAGSEN